MNFKWFFDYSFFCATKTCLFLATNDLSLLDEERILISISIFFRNIVSEKIFRGKSWRFCMNFKGWTWMKEKKNLGRKFVKSFFFIHASSINKKTRTTFTMCPHTTTKKSFHSLLHSCLVIWSSLKSHIPKTGNFCAH